MKLLLPFVSIGKHLLVKRAMRPQLVVSQQRSQELAVRFWRPICVVVEQVGGLLLADAFACFDLALHVFPFFFLDVPLQPAPAAAFLVGG